MQNKNLTRPILHLALAPSHKGKRKKQHAKQELNPAYTASCISAPPQTKDTPDPRGPTRHISQVPLPWERNPQKEPDTMPFKPKETGVPVPPPQKRLRSNLRYGFDRLQIGDSLFVEEPVRRLADSRLYNAARKYAQRDPSFSFTAARYPEGVRVWRIDEPTEPETPEWMA